MADPKRPKEPATHPHEAGADDPFTALPPQHTEPNDVGFEAEPLDLSDLDGLLDDDGVGDFPASDTRAGKVSEPHPLPPPEDTTGVSFGDTLDEMRSFDSPTAQGNPRGVAPAREETMDPSTWDLPNLDETLVPSLGDAEAPSPAAFEAVSVAEEARRHEEERQAEAARAAEEARVIAEAAAAETTRREAAERAAEAAREEAAEAARQEAAEAARLEADVARQKAEAARARSAPAQAVVGQPARPVTTAPSRTAPRPEPSLESAAGAIPPEFRRESQRLARARDWKQLVAFTSAALDEPWAQAPEVRSTLLADLGRIQRDRLADPAGAEKSFEALVLIEPAHVDGFAFLVDAYEQRGLWRSLYDLHVAAVEGTWDPDQRLVWTRRAVQIAEERLLSAELSIDAWERLARLGDAVDETTRALTDAYRSAGRWDRLTDFLERATEHQTGAERRLQLREVAEASLSGLRDAERAAGILDQLLAERPEDPVSLLTLARVESRRRRWDQLFALGTRPTLKRPSGELDPVTTNDLRRIAADALLAGGELDRAAEVYDLVLRERPGDREAILAKERYLGQSGRIAELVAFLAERAGQVGDELEKGKLLERAAEIAERDLKSPERAVQLWEARAQLGHGRLDALRALTQLHESLGDDEGLRRALEGQLKLVQSTAQRIELLRRLGRHAAHRLSDDTLAEQSWSEVLRTVPDDREVREELIALHRRRQDHASLDRTFEGQAWRPAEDRDLRALWLAAAENVEQHLASTGRVGAAWRRVLDLSPGDATALESIVRFERAASSDGRALIAALEAQLRAIGNEDRLADRVELTLEIAARWEGLEDAAAAAAAYERVLWWVPDEATAIDRLFRLRSRAGGPAWLAILDRASTELEPHARLQNLRRQVELLDENDHLGRFYAWRRIYRFTGPDTELIQRMTAEATAAKAFRELEAVLVDLAARADDAAGRRAHHAALAALYERELSDPLRALLALETARHEGVVALGELEPALRLCDLTGRHEDAYALLGVAARHDAPVEVRLEAIRRRASLAEEKLADPERAFHEHVRLLVIDPKDDKALAAARRLSLACKRGRALDALYGELADRATTAVERATLARARVELRNGVLADPSGALDQLWLLYHLAPTKDGEQLLVEAAGAQGAWERVLAVIEARARAGIVRDGLMTLPRIAKLHEAERQDAERALELSAAALVQPGADTERTALEASIERLAAATGKWVWLVEAFRVAAAQAGDPSRALELFRRVAAVYATELRRPELALDVHRRILQLDPNDRGSLEVAIAHLRTAELWRELRDALQHWVEVSRDAGDRATLLERQLEIAAIARDRLGDPELALGTFAAVLDADPTNAHALQGIASLTGGAMTPELEVRRLRLELARATAADRVELVLRIARLYDEQLEDRASAIAALRDLQRETGAAGPAFAPLRALLEKAGAWVDVVDLLEAYAGESTGPAREQALDDALKLAEAHAADVGAARSERLCRLLVAARPDDAEARRRLLSLLRETGRYEELADHLETALKQLGDPDDDAAEEREARGLIEAELVHILERSLGKPGDAGALLLAQIERRPSRPDALLELAGVRLRAGDVAGYLTLRAEHAKTQPATLAAFVLCHLAEASDEKTGDQAKVLDFYRAARALDPTNPSAIDALKAVGRRARSWRAGAALLPDADERELSWRDRARRLLDRAATARTSDPTIARSWLERAIATDPDNHEAWTMLAELARVRHDADEELSARRAALYAFMRASAADPDRQSEHAQLVLAYADALRARGDHKLAARLAWRAYELRPSLPAAALQVANELLTQGRTADAYAIYDRILSAPTPPGPRERLEATFRRGALRARLGDHEAAIADFRDGLRIDELHAPLLAELARVLEATGRVANAASHELQALLFSSDRARRAELYARLGRLFETALDDPDEAGVAYDRAMTFGNGDPQVMLRALGHYRRKGEIDRALSVIEHLIPSTQKPEDLAALWAERGRLLSDRDGDKAVEAFDMALSYDPACAPALTGLAAVLEGRGDWKQLLELLEVRAEQGAPSERAEALRGLSRIAAGHLGDPVRAEAYLREVIALAPSKDDYEQLLRIVGDDPARRDERRDITAALIALGGAILPRVVELGRELVAEGRRQWAWGLLSPLMNTTLSEPSLKSLVLELRKEFEKVETVTRLTTRTHELVRPASISPQLFELLVEVDKLGAVGPTAVEGAPLGKLDARTAVGKTFLALAERLGLDGAALFRAQELPAPFVVLDGDTPQVVLRADLVQLMAPGETNYLFTLALEHARPGARLVTSLPPSERAHFLPALFDVLGIAPSPIGAAALKARLEAIIPAELRPQLAARLSDDDRARGAGPEAAERFVEGIIDTARRVGLIAAADLRFPAKVLTRLDESLPRLPTAGKLDDLEDFFARATPVRALVGFAASSQFARALEV